MQLEHFFIVFDLMFSVFKKNIAILLQKIEFVCKIMLIAHILLGFVFGIEVSFVYFKVTHIHL